MMKILLYADKQSEQVQDMVAALPDIQWFWAADQLQGEAIEQDYSFFVIAPHEVQNLQIPRCSWSIGG